MTTNTQKAKLLRSFKNGSEFTANQIASRFGVANPTAMINFLRRDGYAIYANERTNALGQTYTKYRMGKPTRQMIAAGFAVLGADAAGLSTR
jgi:Mn-dependent DtxR family transcriptional regulator